MPELPPPLPPGERTVGQLIAETIRLYGDNFWRALPLGLPIAVLDQLDLGRGGGVRIVLFLACAPFRFGPAHAAFHIISNLLIEMEPKFGIHAPFPVAAAEWNSHSVVSRTSAMASHSRFQPAVSDSSCRRPSRVRL